MRDKTTLTGLMFFFLSTIPLAIWRAYVIARLWSWYVVPLGVPAIGMVSAYGLGIVAGILTGDIYRAAKSKDVEGDADIIGRIFGTALLTGFAFLLGWIAYQFK
jgi:tetrahydromethanopterin S-methyltransferase subunit C